MIFIWQKTSSEHHKKKAGISKKHISIIAYMRLTLIEYAN